jgi:hypothetical protein
MRMRHSVILAASLVLGVPTVGALADYVYTDANGQHTVFSFVCQTTKLCTGFALIDSTGTEKATLANPIRTDPVGTTTQPVTCVSGCIGGGGANAAASATGSAVPAAADYSGLNISGTLTGQTGRTIGSSKAADVALNDSSGNQINVATSANQATNAATTAHTCSTGGFSELGCLGQIDDDIKAAMPAGTNVIGFTSNDVCAQSQPKNAPFGTAGAANVQAIAPVAAQKVYICSMSLIAGAASSFNIIEGTGAACTTANEAAIIGSTTAANGMALAANGGLTLGNGKGTIGVTATAANGVCILASSSVQFAGNMTYVQQ